MILSTPYTNLKPRTCDIASIFFFNDTATTEIYTLSLNDALPIYLALDRWEGVTKYSSNALPLTLKSPLPGRRNTDRKSTRLNSSHANISYAVFCLKKNKVP